ncbi:MAG: hypothetical protein CSA52_02790 [Gammaproteobacteria bacterium]|nr:MAG: hypothetical protein CSB48_04460 [Pseudomonadota bacterium]PIE38327.1 MAG: hypothetical protein CSA52_02790 [Gammaproteobacteria bacterium]
MKSVCQKSDSGPHRRNNYRKVLVKAKAPEPEQAFSGSASNSRLAWSSETSGGSVKVTRLLFPLQQDFLAMT